MKGLNISHYDCVDDIIDEILSEVCGIKTYYGIDNLEPNVEYVCGCCNIVKLGSKPNTLKHKRDVWSEEYDKTDTNYIYANYYRVDELQKIVTDKLTRKFYNNDFLTLDKE